MSVPSSTLLDAFCDALWLEDGLSRNTLESYRRDLSQFAAWLNAARGASLPEARHDDVLGYLAARVRGHAKSSTTGRQLSSLRRFYQFALRQGKIDIDPTLKVDAPKRPRNLPKTLTEADVENLLAAGFEVSAKWTRQGVEWTARNISSQRLTRQLCYHNQSITLDLAPGEERRVTWAG